MDTSQLEIARANLARWLAKRKFIGNMRFKAEYLKTWLTFKVFRNKNSSQTNNKQNKIAKQKDKE